MITTKTLDSCKRTTVADEVWRNKKQLILKVPVKSQASAPGGFVKNGRMGNEIDNFYVFVREKM